MTEVQVRSEWERVSELEDNVPKFLAHIGEVTKVGEIHVYAHVDAEWDRVKLLAEEVGGVKLVEELCFEHGITSPAAIEALTGS